MKFQRNLIFSFIFFVSIILIGQANGDDPDIDITTIKYTNDFENGNAVTIVSSGKDNATAYNYNFYDDDDDDCDQQSCIPENWYAVDFDDSNWNSGAAPFGNYDLDEVSPGTIWQTEDGGLKDYLIIRHHFTYDGGSETLGATLNLAYNNYYTAYLNGNLIRSCASGWGCSESDAEYWNHELTYDGSSESGPNPDWLVEGENILAILGRDTSSTWGSGDDEQWLDVELVVNVQAWKENPIVLGDDLVLGINFFNNEESNMTDLNVTLEIEGAEFTNQTIEIETNMTFEWTIEWTPDRLGEFNLTAKFLNESLTRTIHVGHYAYNFSVAEDYLVGNTSELLTYNITISNEGDVEDNYTFQIFGTLNDWDIEFVPNVINLAPGETGSVSLEIIPDNDTFSGIYELTLTARSQYHGEIENMIVQSGRDNETEWKWVNSTGGRLYEESNTTWTEIDYRPDSNWTVSPAPFGDDDLSGIDYNTEWSGNNYAYFRHIFYIDNISNYESDTLSLNMAANNYGTYYLNGEEIFDDLGWGSGHYAEYWNEEVKFNSSILKEGKNVLASVVRETGNTQWFDEELVSVTPKSSAWGFQPDYSTLKLEVLPVYAFELVAPIEDKAVSEDELCCEEEWTYKFEIWAYNRGNIGDSYEISISLNDTTNFSIIDFDSIVHAEFEEEVTINLTIALNSSITEYSIGEFNITVTSLNSTNNITKQTTIFARLYVPTDILSPATYATSPELVNSSSFEVSWNDESWYIENLEFGNDTKYVIIEYSTDNGTNGDTWSDWEIWGNFSLSPGNTTFTGGENGYMYRFRSIGGDDDGNIEDKEDKYDDATFVDLIPPEIHLDIDIEGNSTRFNWIEIHWNSFDNNNIITHYDFYYKSENSSWILDASDFSDRYHGFYTTEDGFYQFKIVGHDLAGNQGFNISNVIHIDTKGPSPIIINVPELTDAANLTIDLENKEDAYNFTLFYKLNKEGENNANLIWEEYGNYLVEDLPINISVENEYEYQFRVIAYDLIGNHGNESIVNTLIDQDKPSKVRSLKLAKGIKIVNSTTDISITFMSSPSQDLIEYRIYRSISLDEKGELVGTIPSGNQYLSYEDKNIAIGKTYHYSVVAVDRMNFESDEEKGFINLTMEVDCCTIDDKDDEESNLSTILIGLGIVGCAAGVIAFIGRKTSEEIAHVVGEVVENANEGIGELNFSEVDGELLCNACGAMFAITETSCPSCGTLGK